MFRSSAVRVHALLKNVTKVNNAAKAKPITWGASRLMSQHSTETDEQFDQRYENYFNSPDIDGWDLRRGVTELWGHDLVPEPKILIAVLKACRKVNDLAMAIRILEALYDKCGNKVNDIYPWYMQQLAPTLSELGIPTIEELGYDKPELYLQNTDDM